MQFTWNHSHANVCTSVIQNLLSIFTLLHDWCELELSKMFQFHSTQFQIVASKYQKPNRPSEMFQCSEWLEKQRKVCGAHCSRQTSSFVFTLHSNHSFHYLSAFHLYLCMPKTMSLLQPHFATIQRCLTAITKHLGFVLLESFHSVVICFLHPIASRRQNISIYFQSKINAVFTSKSIIRLYHSGTLFISPYSKLKACLLEDILFAISIKSSAVKFHFPLLASSTVVLHINQSKHLFLSIETL